MTLALAMSFTVNADEKLTKEQRDSIRMEAYRQEIALDYSMPDYSTSKFDESIMGERLAKLLRNLDKNKEQLGNKQAIAEILCSQTEDLSYCTVKKFKILDVTKRGDTITIGIKAWLEPNSAHISDTKLDLIFVKGVSEIMRTNDLFVSLSNTIR